MKSIPFGSGSICQHMPLRTVNLHFTMSVSIIKNVILRSDSIPHVTIPQWKKYKHL